MFSQVRKAGTTDVSVVIRIIDSTDGTPETGVVYNTSGIALEYRREGATSTAITEADLAGLDSAHADGGFKHIGNGYYRLDLPDAACATSSTGVLVHGTVTGMVVIGCYIQLVTYDPFDGVRLGLTALPNAAADAAGGLPISDSGGLDLDAIKTKTDYLPSAAAGAAGGVFIAGTNAATTITSSGGSALTLSSTGGNGSGLVVTGNGTGKGIAATGGASGAGISAVGGATANGYGIYAEANSADCYGLQAVGKGATESGGIKGVATTAGEGIEGLGAGNGHGLYAVGAGTGEGVHATAGGGANGHGAHFEGVGANSSGLMLSRGGTGGDDLAFATNDCTIPVVTALGAGAVTAAAIATGAIDADALAADASAEIADAVWDEALAGHAGAGSTGAALAAAGTAGDPWSTALPGAYGAGTAGKILGDNLNAPVATVDTVVDAIKLKTDNLPATPASQGDITGLNDLSSGDVTTATAAALEAAISEPANLSATKSVKSLLYWVFSRFYHRNSQTAAQQLTYKADGATVLATRTVSDDGTTQELGAGS
jgi:hypothetical protein